VIDIAQALRGSGGSYGYPTVSAAAGVVAADPRDRLLPKLLGLIDLLRRCASHDDGPGRGAGRWLAFASGAAHDWSREDAAAVDLEGAWKAAAVALGVDDQELARRIAVRLGIELADPAAADGFAALLVPPALALEHSVLPISEDGTQIVAASANPTDVSAMATLERATGRMARLDILPPDTLRRILVARYGEPTGARILDAVVPAANLDRGAFRDEAPDDLTILVVDDEPGTRLSCRTVLEREGFRVIEAEGGREALDALSAQPGTIDLALVDVLMPDMDGRELVKTLREDPVLVGLPVIVLTGLHSTGSEAKLMEQGADDYLRKPVEPPILIARIRAILRRVRATQTP
jgi:CheY-like chemotaxis protein